MGLFEIQIKEPLTKGWEAWFEDMEFRYEADGEMILCGLLADQAALHGVLARIRDLGLTLISVKQVDSSAEDTSEQ